MHLRVLLPSHFLPLALHISAHHIHHTGHSSEVLRVSASLCKISLTAENVSSHVLNFTSLNVRKITGYLPWYDRYFWPHAQIFLSWKYTDVSCSVFQKSPQHIHIQRFPKSAWSCKKCYHRTFINEIFYQHRLINIVIFRLCQPEIWHTDWQRQAGWSLIFR